DYPLFGSPRQGAVEGYCQELWTRIFQAASSFTPSLNTTPAITSANSGAPFKARQRLAADSISWNTIVRHATRVPLPLVLSVRNRTVANTDSMGLVDRRCRQCSAGKS